MARAKKPQPVMERLVATDHWVRNSLGGHYYRCMQIEPERREKSVMLNVSITFGLGTSDGVNIMYWMGVLKADCCLVLYDMLKILTHNHGTKRSACPRKVTIEQPLFDSTKVTFQICTKQGR